LPLRESGGKPKKRKQTGSGTPFMLGMSLAEKFDKLKPANVENAVGRERKSAHGKGEREKPQTRLSKKLVSETYKGPEI